MNSRTDCEPRGAGASPSTTRGRCGRAAQDSGLPRVLSRPSALLSVLVCWLWTFGGCFSERSFVMRPRDYTRVSVAGNPHGGPPRDTREWLVRAHQRLAGLLPPSDAPALTTDELLDAEGRPVDVYRHFRIDPAHLNSIFGNFHGLLHTAQASGAEEAIEKPAPPWPGFEDVWIPIHDRLRLSARLGLARDAAGRPRRADCIVIIPGLLGDLAVRRTRDMGQALLSAGLHVLALELRGFGQTERFYPHVYYNFGVLETGDLLAVAEWLQDRPEVRETGLVGFCWGANHAMLAAWEDGRPPDDPIVAERLRPYLRPHTGRRHYRAGVIAFSPTVAFEEIVELLRQREYDALSEPVLATLQKGVRARMHRKQHGPVCGDLGRLIEYEFAASELNYPGAVDDGYQYLRFLPFRGKPAGDKLEHVRVPLLIVHGANDPLASPQALAELIAATENRNVAAIVLPGGGHVGFAPYCRSYFYSLLLNFFDAEQGAARAVNHER